MSEILETSDKNIRNIILYNQDTGALTWKQSRGGKAKDGAVAGTSHNRGYIIVRVNGRRYLAHRLAWFLYYGVWPEKQIDHINGIRSDNRIVNLRDVSPVVNCQNLRKPTIRNKSGYLGVMPSGDRWMAQIRINGNRTHLGRFKTPEEAHAAYLEAKRRFHEGNTI